jgi:hypothetical protein
MIFIVTVDSVWVPWAHAALAHPSQAIVVLLPHGQHHWRQLVVTAGEHQRTALAKASSHAAVYRMQQWCWTAV